MGLNHVRFCLKTSKQTSKESIITLMFSLIMKFHAFPPKIKRYLYSITMKHMDFNNPEFLEVDHVL